MFMNGIRWQYGRINTRIYCLFYTTIYQISENIQKKDSFRESWWGDESQASQSPDNRGVGLGLGVERLTFLWIQHYSEAENTIAEMQKTTRNMLYVQWIIQYARQINAFRCPDLLLTVPSHLELSKKRLGFGRPIAFVCSVIPVSLIFAKLN